MHRLNTDGRGVLLGEFQGDDKLIVRTAKNVYYTTNFDITQHFPDDTVHVSKYSPDTVYAVAYFDRSQNYYYLKRFTAEQGAVLVLTFQGAQASRPAEEIDVDGFVGVKSHRAKGKRLTTYDVATLAFVEPEPSGEDAPNGSEGDFDLPETMTVEGTDAEFEIERPKGDTEEVIVDTEQLNLF